MIENVLNLLEKLPAIGIVTREHGSHSVCEGMRALELELAE